MVTQDVYQTQYKCMYPPDYYFSSPHKKQRKQYPYFYMTRENIILGKMLIINVPSLQKKKLFT